MKNTEWFPFERNRYYYGKFLSVNDFELEQKYVNNKRSFINRFLFGMGIITGLGVAAVDEKNISIDVGVAIDYLGREIVIDSPVRKNLNDIAGFDDCEEKSIVYLCLEYDETETEPVNSISGKENTELGNIQYNRYAEGYKLCIKNNKPLVHSESLKQYYQNEKIIYSSDGLSISIIVPRIVREQEKAKIEIKIDKGNILDELSFNFNMSIFGFTYNKSDIISVIFDEKEHKQNQSYNLIYYVDAKNISGDFGNISILKNSFTLTLNDYSKSITSSYKERIKVTFNDTYTEVINNFYQNYMDDTIKSIKYHPDLCIAEIHVIRSGDSYIINSVKSNPFKQYVFNPQFSGMLFDMYSNKNEVVNKAENTNKEKKEIATEKNNIQQQYTISSGTEIISLGIGGKYKQCFFSEPVAHGLGIGPVDISLGMAETMSDSSEIIYGSSEIFNTNKNKDAVKAEMAAKLNPEDGTFVIGIKLLDTTVASQLKIHWTAIRRSIDDTEKHERRIFIEPGIVEINVRSTFYFTARLENIAENGVLWDTDENSGGSINANGMYIAPNIPGIYSVIASSEAYPSVKTSVFVIVREENSR